MSRIEQLISEIEEYIEGCKFQALSNTKILVNKEELEELLVELRLRVPEEIKKYQKIISNQDIILSEAKSQADAMLAEANQHTNELVNEHEIMQRAYANADLIIEDAQMQASGIIDGAINDANSIRQSAMNYTDEMLQSLEAIIAHSLNDTKIQMDSLLGTMQNSYDIVAANRSELAAGMNATSVETDERAL